MADFKKLSWMQSRLKTTPRMTYEDIDPGSGWTNDPQSRSHQLLVDLPGFKKEDIKLQIDDTGTIVVSGGRRVAESKRVRFQKTFKVPEDSDIKNISTDFKGDTFEVNIPKVVKKNGASSSQVVEEKREELESSKDVKEKHEQNVPDKTEEPESVTEAKRDGKEEEKVDNKEMKEEMKEEPGIKKDGLSNDSKEDKKEEIVRSEEEREIKNGVLSHDAYEEHESSEENGVLSNDVREEHENSRDTKETEEKPVTKKVALNDKTKEDEEKSEVQNGALSDDLSEEKKEEPEAQKTVSRSESGNSKEENIEKPDEQGNGYKNSRLGKGKDNPSNGKTSEKSVMEKIIEQRSILLASIISFTLGVLLSGKFHKPPSK